MLRRTLVALALTLTAVAGPATAGGAVPANRPDRIPLPDGYRPEGIAAAGGTVAFVGSIPTGAVSLVDVRTGDVANLVPGRPGRAAIGLEEAGGLLFVAGGPTGNAFVYDARTGGDVAVVRLTSPRRPRRRRRPPPSSTTSSPPATPHGSPTRAPRCSGGSTARAWPCRRCRWRGSPGSTRR